MTAAHLTPNLVSIVTPAYNSAATMEATIQSVLSQTHQSWELLVVIDQGTKDATPDIVLNYSATDPRIRLLKVPQGKGLALSRNYALSQARGQYVAFLDSDDVWLPEKLEKQLEHLKKNNGAFATHRYRRMSFDEKTVGHLLNVPAKITYKDLLVNNVIGCLTVLVDQSQTGPLQFEETKHEDFLLWLSLLKRGFDCYGLQEDLARYRIVPSSRSANKFEMAAVRWKILRKHERLNVFSSLYYLSGYVATSLNKYKQF
ncbi:MAG: glycosyltransferase family 2 protein [Bdellovibrionales bacterium]|nr:glycosyltransferase family 2 protein [Bdellovibrionales bacterium]